MGQTELHIQLEIVLKQASQKGFQVLPKRWDNERTNAWITRQRRLMQVFLACSQNSMKNDPNGQEKLLKLPKSRRKARFHSLSSPKLG